MTCPHGYDNRDYCKNCNAEEELGASEDRVIELETKLAESEDKVRLLSNNDSSYGEIIDEWKKKVAALESRLAEKDKVIEKAVKHLGTMLTYTMRPGDSSRTYTEKKQMAIDFIATHEAKGGK